MLKNTSTLSYLVTALAVAPMAVGCSADTGAPAPGAGGQTTNGGRGGQSTGGSGGSTGGGGGATGGSSAGTAGVGGGDAATENPPPQADTAVILIDNVIIMRKPATDAGGSDAAAASDASDGAMADAAVPSEASIVRSAGLRYTFDSDLQGWAYTPYGSTPNIGFLDTGGAGLKLSDPTVSQLAFDGTNDADGRVDASGAMKLTVGFLAANDRIGLLAFTVNPNDATQWVVWSGFVATAKIRLVSGGNLDRTCPLRAELYSSTGTGFATAASPVVNLTTAMTDWSTITFDFDTVVPGANGQPNLTQINQLGIHITTGTCP
jgi:hypothetical protein